MRPNPYLPIPAALGAVVDETPEIKTLAIRPREPIPFRAGQFVALTVPGVGEAPFTPSSSPAVGEQLEITIMKVGRVTTALHGLGEGDTVGVRGPLGTGYPLGEFRGREVLVVGGGCGVGPLRALLYALLEEPEQYGRIKVRYGARSPQDIVFQEWLRGGCDREGVVDTLVTVDLGNAGWTGPVGVVTTILDENHLQCDPRRGVAAVCGPPLMMRFVIRTLLARGYEPDRLYLSVERNMSCGMGHCGHCRCGRYYVCRDGPVFTYRQLADCRGALE